MNKVMGLVALAIFGLIATLIVEMLSSDAVGMSLGLLMGVMAGVPCALLVMAGNRQGRDHAAYEAQEQRRRAQLAESELMLLRLQIQARPQREVIVDGWSAISSTPSERGQRIQMIAAPLDTRQRRKGDHHV